MQLPDGLEDRLKGYLDKVAGGVLDEPATARALADVLARGLDCGAVDEVELRNLAGLDATELAALRRNAGPGGAAV